MWFVLEEDRKDTDVGWYVIRIHKVQIINGIERMLWQLLTKKVNTVNSTLSSLIRWESHRNY